MSRKWRIKPHRSLHENARLLVPAMFDEMISYRTKVVSRPNATDELHRMRIAGKPLRYAMETFQPSFGRRFQDCLGDIKGFLELAGQIHDCDVMTMLVKHHCEETRTGGHGGIGSAGKSSKSTLVRFLRAQQAMRRKKFNQLCKTLMEWENQGIREQLVKAMK